MEPYGGRGKAMRWYKSARWRRRRDQQLKAEPLCRYCLDQGKAVPATVADHVEPHRGDAEAFWHGRLQSTCAPCHNSIKQALERTGKLRGCDVTGHPLDPNHHWNKGRT